VPVSPQGVAAILFSRPPLVGAEQDNSVLLSPPFLSPVGSPLNSFPQEFRAYSTTSILQNQP